MENHDNIELRSEKVRNIIGQIPPRIIRIGITIFFIIFVLLACVAYNYRFPLKTKVQAQLWQTNDKISYTLFVPTRSLKHLKNNDIIKFNLPDNQLIELNSNVYLSDSSTILKQSGLYNKITGKIVSTNFQIIDTLNIEAAILGDSVNVIDWIMMK